MQPFLKWAGGKRWLRPELRAMAGTLNGRYIEPFLGSGAIFFDLRPSSAILSDVNPDLINTYSSIKLRPDLVERYLKMYARQHSDEFYYRVRNEKWASPFRSAAQFIYLNRTCWNGLYRVNLKGQFNVPRGTKNTIILPGENFEAISNALKSAEIRHGDFESTVDLARSGDLVYCDPPYTVHHEMNGFVKYNENIFSWTDQIRLRDAAIRAVRRGARVIVSNACHHSVHDLYRESAVISKVQRSSVISGSNKGRGDYNEIIAEFMP